MAKKSKEKAPKTPAPVAATPPAGATPAPARGLVPAMPFGVVRRFAEEMDRFFDDVRSGLAHRFDFPKIEAAWAPVVEVSERGGKLVVRAELPGLARKDVKVEVRDDALVLQGERRQEREERKKGYFRSERSYGSFYRQIPLPEGTDPASATATFKDGVLEVTMPAPPKPAKGRSVPIEEG